MRSVLYRPPSLYPDFQVTRLELPARVPHTLPIAAATLLLVFAGSGRARAAASAPLPLRAGTILFACADTAVELEADTALTLFCASPNL